MQSQLVKERELTIQRDNLEKQRQQLDEQISRLSQPDGSEDARLNVLAERFGGVLLSELYDDVPIEDAPYFSALYGPARHAIVVRDLNTVREQLANLEDCPDDLYLIEVTQMPLMTAYFQPKSLKWALWCKCLIVNCVIQNSRKFRYLAVLLVKNI